MRLLLLLLVLAGCGYRFTAPGGPLPQGIRAVQAPVFSNITPEPQAETYFTQALREQLIRSGTLGGDDADAQIQGTVLAVSAAPMIVTSGPPTYRLTATVDLKLVRSGAVIAQAVVSGEEDVVPGTASTSEQSIINLETNRQAGLRRLADSLMREGYERLCTGW